MLSLCSAHQDASNDINIDLEVTLRSRDLRTPLDLNHMRSSYANFDAYKCEDLHSCVTFVLARLVQKKLTKKKLLWPPVPLF